MDEVNPQRLRNTLETLEGLTRIHGGGRAFGSKGYEYARKYIQWHAQRYRDKFDIYLQPFKVLNKERYSWEPETSLTANGQMYRIDSILFSPPTPPGGINATLLSTPPEGPGGHSMCSEDQWRNLNATGKIVLVELGGCRIPVKARHAKNHGALAMIVYESNPWSNQMPHIVEHHPEDLAELIPVVSFHNPKDDFRGNKWRRRLDRGETIELHLVVDSTVEFLESWNIIVQTKQGDPNKVIMLGAHLDTVPQSPGINDNSSGVAALLELMEIVARHDSFPHTIRFA